MLDNINKLLEDNHNIKVELWTRLKEEGLIPNGVDIKCYWLTEEDLFYNNVIKYLSKESISYLEHNKEFIHYFKILTPERNLNVIPLAKMFIVIYECEDSYVLESEVITAEEVKDRVQLFINEYKKI